ncbi:MAG: PIN domain-containing protein [Selenomonadaceae bacterium]|nr:PIN domain-containing protein [Selenomonadaceae bacterium]
MKKFLIDANVILRYLLNDIEDMANEAKKVIDSGAWTLPEVIAEVVYVLKSVYKVDRKEIANAILEILKEIEIEHKNVMNEALKIFSETNLDFVDCILIAYNKVENIEIFSFDKKLNNKLNQ